jgi:hypothetical protein
MSPSERERRERRDKLRRTRRELDRCQEPAAKGNEAEHPRNGRHWDDLVERRIQQAMAAGAFENLSGRGKRLDLRRNPYLDPSLELAYGLLKDNGYTPEWITRDQEIRRELGAARGRLRVAWTQHQASGASVTAWQQAVSLFEEALTQLNRKIDDLNLVVPVPSCQRVRLNLADELRRLEIEKTP